MVFRRWLLDLMLGDGAEGDSPPPDSVLLETLIGHEPERKRALGDYDSSTYPVELLDLVAGRDEVAQELLRIDIADSGARVAAIPRLRQLLVKYPHPLVYETLIHACIDAGRFDEARGVAFAARQRRQECATSDIPEIRAEIEHLREWTLEDIESLRLAVAKRLPSK